MKRFFAFCAVVALLVGFYRYSYSSGYSSGYEAGYQVGLSENSKIRSSQIMPNRSTPRLPEYSETVYITKTGDKYHKDGCRYLSKSKIEISLEVAIQQGYTPCSRCW